MRICSKGATSKLPQWLTSSVNLSWTNQQFALIEFDSEEEAERAVESFKNPDNW